MFWNTSSIYIGDGGEGREKQSEQDRRQDGMWRQSTPLSNSQDQSRPYILQKRGKMERRKRKNEKSVTPLSVTHCFFCVCVNTCIIRKEHDEWNDQNYTLDEFTHFGKYTKQSIIMQTHTHTYTHTHTHTLVLSLSLWNQYILFVWPELL